MRVKTVDEEEYTGVYLPHQIAENVLFWLRKAEPELADVRVAGGELPQPSYTQKRQPCAQHLIIGVCI